MNLLDRSIVRQFLGTFAFALLAIIVIFVVIDAMENLDDFIDRDTAAPVILRYYLFFMPEIIKLVTPVAMLLASLFVTARMSTQNELTAMKTAGVSLARLMAPFIALALLVSAFSVWFNGWIVPHANRLKFAIEREYLQKNLAAGVGSNIYFQDSPVRILGIGAYDPTRTLATRVTIQDFAEGDLTVLRARIDALSMQWDSTARRWVLMNGTRRSFDGGVERMEPFGVLTADRLRVDAEELRKKQEKPDEMEYLTLGRFIENQRAAGQDVSRWLVDFYSKVSFPFASVIVVLFGVPFSSVKRRGGAGVQLGISLLICFIYLIFMKVSQVFGYNGDLPPLLTAWAANILFLAAALLVIARVPK